MKTLTGKYARRESGIELLKIIAIFLIVVNHVIQSLTEVSTALPNADYVINITSNTTSIQTLLIAILRSTGCIGNDIFVICSAWFLIDSRRCDKRKVSFLVCNVWTVSVLILLVTLALGCHPDRDTILKQLFPTSNGNNWFITCYILLFLIHPLLNKVIDSLDRRRLLSIACLMVFLYAIVNYFRPWFFDYAPFYMNDLIVWIMMYFALAYIKKYMPDFCGNTRANVIGLLIGIFGQAAMTVLSDVAGLKFGTLADRLLYFNYGGSPFIILLAICAFNLARKLTFRSSFINYISSLSLLIYIIHENYILRGYYRPWIFYYIYNNFGYRVVVLWVLAAAATIFVAAIIVSAIYNQTIERLVRPVSRRIYDLLAKIWNWLSGKLLKLH